MTTPPSALEGAGGGEASASFRESKICVAVDVSGSTYGRTLQAEKLAIKQVCSLIPSRVHQNITIVPWNDAAKAPRPFSQLDSLQSSGGTDPNVVIDDPDCRLLLQDSGFWFLMTDGEIDDRVVRKFSRNLTDYGMHGKACIIAVFGERVSKPSDCRISVGFSVFAVSPHVAFLYTDVESGRTFILSTKGCFSSLLPAGKRNPRLDYNTTWDELPQVSYEDLTRVSVPAAQRLGRDEIALQDDTRVNIPALLSQATVDENLMRQIMLNEDNMKTVALTARLRGESDKLEKWLDKVDDKLGQENHEEQVADDVETQLLKDIKGKIEMADESRLFLDLQHRQLTVKYAPVQGLTTTNTMLRSMPMMRSLSMEGYGVDDVGAIGAAESYEYLDTPPTEDLPSHWPDPKSTQNEYYQCVPGDLSLAVAGFLRPAQQKDQFSGFCSACGRFGVVLALVLRIPPRSAVTANFPTVGSMAKLAYPLTMGNYAETDIIADTIACDDCAAGMAKAGTTALNENITVVLPLVSYSKNQGAWLQTLNLATSRRFCKSDLPQVFLGILSTKMERLAPDPSTLADLRAALKWEGNMLQSEVVLQADTLPLTIPFGAGLLQEVLLRNFRDSLIPDKFPLLLTYPLDGFIVANAALSNSKYGKALTQEKRKLIVFFRFLSHLLENFREYAEESGEVQLHAATTLILLMDDPSGPRSLFRWGSLRQFSFRFEKVEDLRRHLRDNVALNRYRLSLAITDLLDTPLLSTASLAAFRRLGPLFSWIESEAGHSIAVFVHYLMRLDVGKCSESHNGHFRKLRERQEVEMATTDPGALSARDVERLIKPLPLLEY